MAQQGAPDEHRYPGHATYIAGLRALAGITASVGLWVLAGGLPVAVISTAGTAIFVVYGVIAIGRAKEVLVLSEDGIGVTGWRPRKIRFSHVSAVRLAYYSTRKDGEKGWMELTVKAGGQRLVVESEIAGFERIAAAIFDAIGKNGIPLSPVSERNFAVLLDDSVTMGQKPGLVTARAAR